MAVIKYCKRGFGFVKVVAHHFPPLSYVCECVYIISIWYIRHIVILLCWLRLLVVLMRINGGLLWFVYYVERMLIVGFSHPWNEIKYDE